MTAANSECESKMVSSLVFIKGDGKTLSMLISQNHIQCKWREIQENGGVYLRLKSGLMAFTCVEIE